MIDDEAIERVDRFGEKLRDKLKAVGREGRWGDKFDLSKPAVSDYYRSPVIVDGNPIKKNWIQLNGHTYFHPSYSSPKPWKLQARFPSCPSNPLWEGKPPYQRNRQPQEWSLGGSDVFAISYESLTEILSGESEDGVMDEILEDLRISWSYANGYFSQSNLSKIEASERRSDITLSINTELWSRFQTLYSLQYRSRKKHPKRPSYADLRNEAIDSAIADYIAKWKISF